jgi:diguanylate cyclase (GGDEF)-like protein
MEIRHLDRKFLAEVLSRYGQKHRLEFSRLLQDTTISDVQLVPMFHLSEPQAVEEFHTRLDATIHTLDYTPAHEVEVDDSHASFIKEALIAERIEVASRVEVHKTRTVDPELTRRLETQLEPYERLIRESWLRNARALDVPQPRDYFPLHMIEKLRESDPLARVLDEKFQTLQAPSLFQSDLAFARQAGIIRDISCAVAYLDIDDFKKVNTDYGEPFVDLNVLPRLMRTLAAHVYQRGHAYRIGGDEYVILLNNTSLEEAAKTLNALRNAICTMKFPSTNDGFRVTVSVGLVLVTPGCHLTGREIESAAARAKQQAKQSGKNRVMGFEDPWFEEFREL